MLSRGDLIGLIEQNDLYPSERRSQPLSYVVDKMRESTTVGALAGDIGAGGGPNKNNVIAIKMDFDYPDPGKAQAVMQAYVTQFMRMNSDQIEDQANLTVRFLQEQASKLRGQIQAIEGEITSLKASNGAVLTGANGPTFVDTGSYSAQIASLVEAEGRGDGGDGGGVRWVDPANAYDLLVDQTSATATTSPTFSWPSVTGNFMPRSSRLMRLPPPRSK